jgi:hypothetical protein
VWGIGHWRLPACVSVRGCQGTPNGNPTGNSSVCEYRNKQNHTHDQNHSIIPTVANGDEPEPTASRTNMRTLTSHVTRNLAPVGRKARSSPLAAGEKAHFPNKCEQWGDGPILEPRVSVATLSGSSHPSLARSLALTLLNSYDNTHRYWSSGTRPTGRSIRPAMRRKSPRST